MKQKIINKGSFQTDGRKTEAIQLIANQCFQTLSVKWWTDFEWQAVKQRGEINFRSETIYDTA